MKTVFPCNELTSGASAIGPGESSAVAVHASFLDFHPAPGYECLSRGSRGEAQDVDVALTIVIKGTAPDPNTADLALTFDSSRVTIGRGKSCDLWLPDPTVAKRHAALRQEGGKTLITDEGSLNGVIVDRVRLPPRAPRALEEGALVRVGRYWLEVRPVGGVASSPQEVRRVALTLMRQQLERDGEPTCAVIEIVGATGPTGQRLELRDDTREYRIGRGRDCDLELTDELASRRHVAVAWQGEGWAARDLGSKQGSFLRSLGDGEGEPLEIALGEPLRSWRDRELLRIGSTLLQLVDPLMSSLEETLAVAEVKLRPEELREPAPGSDAVGGDPIVAPADPIAPPPEAEADDEQALLDEALALAGTKPKQRRVSVDAVVVLVALGLLGLSSLGLMWLLR